MKSFVKLDEAPVATVSNKVKTSRRCFEARQVWDYLQMDSEIYNGDRIRTEEKSQVMLTFENGMVVTLTPNTMTTITVDEEKGVQILLSGGSLIVDSVQKEGGATIIYNQTSVAMTGKAVVSAVEVVDKQKLEVQVFEGSAQVQSGQEKKVQINDGQMVTVKTLEAAPVDEISDPISVLEGNPEPVTVLVEVKEDLTSYQVEENTETYIFENAAELTETLATVNEVESVEELEKAGNEEVFALIQDVFYDEGTSAASDAVAKPKETVKQEVFTKNQAKASSKTNSQTTAKTNTSTLGAPTQATPENNKILNDTYFLKNSGIEFSWATVTGATNYEIILKNDKGKVLLKKNLGKVNRYLYSDLMNLNNGSFEWTVQALKCDSSGKVLESSVVKSSKFVIRLGAISGETSEVGEAFGKE